MYNIIVTLIIGLIAGIVGSSVGSAGGAILLPGLLIAKIVPNYKIALGTVLLSLLAPVSIGALIPYWKHKQIDFKVAIILTIANIIGAYIGGDFISKHVSNHTLHLIYGIYLLFLSFYFFYKYKKKLT